jgi:hypothetical protein
VPQPQTPLTLLDACAVVNLYATRCMGDILTAVAGPVAIADVVAREAQFIFRGGAGDDAREREPVDLQPLLDNGLLAVIATDVEEELLTFIDLKRIADQLSSRGTRDLVKSRIRTWCALSQARNDSSWACRSRGRRQMKFLRGTHFDVKTPSPEPGEG